jgi:alcohol dehydrogenase class IV
LDALCAPNASPLDTFAATEAMRVISAALQRLLANSADRRAWSDALYGAWLAGVGAASSTVHSKLCQALVDTCGLVHAEVACVMLPYTAAYRRKFAPKAIREAAAAMRADDAPQAFYDLMQLAATRKSFRQMEVTTSELEALCDSVKDFGDLESASRADCLGMLMAAYEGRRP